MAIYCEEFLNGKKQKTVKFRYCEKATTFVKISNLILTLLCKVKTILEIFSNFEPFSQYLNFTCFLIFLNFQAKNR